MDVLACKIDKELESVEYDNASSGIKVSQKTLDDYWRFFTTEEGADILPYAYMGPSHYYNDLIKNCEDYYLCRDEIEILSKNNEAFKKHLSGIECVMEIGPGSVHAVENKSLNILNSAKDLKLYQGVDYSKSYLKEACDFVKERLPGIEVEEIEADLMKISEVKDKECSKYKKAIVFLGSTLGNFKLDQQKHIINQFSKLANEGDLLILTVDTNEDKESLLKAYDNNFMRTIAKSSLEYYSRINPLFKKFINLFDIKIEVNEANHVEIFFEVKVDFVFKFNDENKVSLLKGKKLYGILSHKLGTRYIEGLLEDDNFDVLNVISNGNNRMKIFICKKNERY